MSIYVNEPSSWRESWVNFSPDEVKCSHCGELKIHEDIMDLRICLCLSAVSFSCEESLIPKDVFTKLFADLLGILLFN